MDKKENAEFKHVREAIGTLLLALNCPGWSDQDRAALLLLIDALECELIDMKRDADITKPAHLAPKR